MMFWRMLCATMIANAMKKHAGAAAHISAHVHDSWRAAAPLRLLLGCMVMPEM
jgi:hypothetical protein